MTVLSADIREIENCTRGLVAGRLGDRERRIKEKRFETCVRSTSSAV